MSSSEAGGRGGCFSIHGARSRKGTHLGERRERRERGETKISLFWRRSKNVAPRYFIFLQNIFVSFATSTYWSLAKSATLKATMYHQVNCYQRPPTPIVVVVVVCVCSLLTAETHSLHTHCKTLSRTCQKQRPGLSSQGE